MTVPVHRTYSTVTVQPGLTVPIHRIYFSVTEQPRDCSSPQCRALVVAAGFRDTSLIAALEGDDCTQLNSRNYAQDDCYNKYRL